MSSPSMISAVVIAGYPAYARRVSTLPERLASLCTPQGKWSRNALSLAAGLSQSHVGQIIRGTLGDGVGLDKYIAIADAAKVSRAWLLLGEGPKERDHGQRIDDRKRAIELLRGFVSERVLSALATDPTNEARSLESWFDLARRLRAAYAEGEPMPTPGGETKAPRLRAAPDVAGAAELEQKALDSVEGAVGRLPRAEDPGAVGEPPSRSPPARRRELKPDKSKSPGSR